MKIWVKTKEFSEGKFLVVRRDGSVPAWPHFVLGARDPAAPIALRAYADTAATLGFDPEYVASIRELADDFDRYRAAQGDGDADAAPHRNDDPDVIHAMRRNAISIFVYPSNNMTKEQKKIGAEASDSKPVMPDNLATHLADTFDHAADDDSCYALARDVEACFAPHPKLAEWFGKTPDIDGIEA